ncbi:MAG TPA: YetF domain-containing protein [Gemmatimonadales bacterium]|nr:YetF domain-containing protein [Gemmatimonadales bacterium]
MAAVAAYATLILFLRISGKRTLAKLNAFDLVVTVALGSTLASIVTSDRLPLANGLLALALLIALQYAVAWVNLRVEWFRRLVKSDPTLLFHRGAFIDEALRGSRVGRDAVLSAVRGAGVMRLADVAAVVLEPDGSLSVVAGENGRTDATSLRDLSGAAAEPDLR